MRAFIAWLSKRFPAQLVVTVDEYKQMREELAQYNTHHQALIELNTRLSSVESQLKRLNEANGFVNTSKGSFSLER